MNKYLNAGVAALMVTGTMLATATPAAAQDNGRNHNGAIAASGHRASGSARAVTGSNGVYGGGYSRGYNNGGYGGYDNGGDYAGAALAGLAVGAAIGNSGYGGGYGPSYGYGPGPGYAYGPGYGYAPGYGGYYAPGYAAPNGGCVSQQWVWSPRSGRYVLRNVPYAC